MLLKRRQVVIYVVAGMLVTDFVFFGYMPSHKRLKAIRQARAEQTRVIAQAAAESEQLPVLEKQMAQLTKIVADYEAKVPLKRDLGTFLRQIANLMTKHNLTDQVVAPGTEMKTDDLNCIPVEMKCKGRLTQIFEFYNQLRELDRLIRIEQVTLANDDGFSGIIDMHTKAVIYYRTQGKQT